MTRSSELRSRSGYATATRLVHGSADGCFRRPVGLVSRTVRRRIALETRKTPREPRLSPQPSRGSRIGPPEGGPDSTDDSRSHDLSKVRLEENQRSRLLVSATRRRLPPARLPPSEDDFHRLGFRHPKTTSTGSASAIRRRLPPGRLPPSEDDIHRVGFRHPKTTSTGSASAIRRRHPPGRLPPSEDDIHRVGFRHPKTTSTGFPAFPSPSWSFRTVLVADMPVDGARSAGRMRPPRRPLPLQPCGCKPQRLSNPPRGRWLRRRASHTRCDPFRGHRARSASRFMPTRPNRAIRQCEMLRRPGSELTPLRV